MSDAYRIGGSKRLHIRKQEGRSWTTQKEKIFITTLGETCNVVLSARRAGVSTTCIYERRNKNASFRASWDAALATGYAQLELMMLERALHGVEKRIVARDGSTTVMRHYSDRTALALLRMHRENAVIAGDTVDNGEWQEARDRIAARLQRIRDRKEESVETKAASNPIRLIHWGLAQR